MLMPYLIESWNKSKIQTKLQTKRGPAEIAKPNLAYSLKMSSLRLHLKKLNILRI